MLYADQGDKDNVRQAVAVVLYAELCARLIEAVEGWAAEAEAEIETWPRTRGLGATEATNRRLKDLIGRSRHLLTRTEAPS